MSYLRKNEILHLVLLFASVYIFIFGLCGFSGGFEALSREFSKQLIKKISDPLSAFVIGLLATAIIQSSSVTTTMLISLVAAGIAPFNVVIPAIFGANLGTAITNTFVSLGFITRKEYFRKAFATAIIHDFFNITGIIVIFPLELLFQPLEKIALFMAHNVAFVGIKFKSPVKFITDPILKPLINTLKSIFPQHWQAIVIIFSGFLIVIALTIMIKCMNYLIKNIRYKILTKSVFTNPYKLFFIGLGYTAVVQSSSITTSTIIPLSTVDLINLDDVFSYTAGCNIGTTVTGLFASFALGNLYGIALAFVHSLFNIFTTCIFAIIKPLRIAIIGLVKKISEIAVARYGKVVIIGYIGGIFYILPTLYLIFTGILR